MRLSVAHLRHHPRVFKQMTGLTVIEFEEVVHDLLPVFPARQQQRLSRPDRQRAIGGGPPSRASPVSSFCLRSSGCVYIPCIPCSASCLASRIRPSGA